MKKIFTIFTFLFLSLVLALPARAQEDATSSADAETKDSYVLFWPLAAGKTEGDRFYQLKLFKEKFRGWFVFIDNKKVDYAVLLGTKRVLEAEKLLAEGKTEPAIKTLKRAQMSYTEAYDLAKKAHAKRKFSAKEIRGDRLTNVKRLLDYLKAKSGEEVDKELEATKGKVNLILEDYIS